MAGQLIQVATETVTSAVASVTLTGIDSDDVYMVTVANVIPTTDDKNLQVRVTVSGTAQTTSNYDEASKNLRTDTTFSNSGLTNLDRWQPQSASGSATGESGNLILYLFNFNNSSEYSFVTVESNYINASGNLFGHQGGGVYTVAEAHNGINFSLESSDTFESGTFTLYKVVWYE